MKSGPEQEARNTGIYSSLCDDDEPHILCKDLYSRNPRGYVDSEWLNTALGLALEKRKGIINDAQVGTRGISEERSYVVEHVVVKMKLRPSEANLHLPISSYFSGGLCTSPYRL